MLLEGAVKRCGQACWALVLDLQTVLDPRNSETEGVPSFRGLAFPPLLTLTQPLPGQRQEAGVRGGVCPGDWEWEEVDDCRPGRRTRGSNTTPGVLRVCAGGPYAAGNPCSHSPSPSSAGRWPQENQELCLQSSTSSFSQSPGVGIENLGFAAVSCSCLQGPLGP